MSEKVKVEYRTEQSHCSCCGHKLEKPKTSGIREFYFSKDNCTDWLEQENWRYEAKYSEAFQQMVEEFIYDTISFFATSPYERIRMEKSEIEKVKQMILKEVIAS